MNQKFIFGTHASMLVYEFAKMFGDYSNATPHTQRSVEDAFIKFYGINPKSATADDEINTRPLLVQALMQLSTEYSNILRYDPNAIIKYKSFVCFDKDCFKEYGIPMKVSRKTLLYVNSIIARNHKMLDVLEDGFPRDMDIYKSTFYDHFANNLFVRSAIFVLVENEQFLPSKRIIKQCQRCEHKINGVSIFKAKDIPSILLSGSDMLSKKTHLFCY